MEPAQPEATIRRCLYRDLDRLLHIYNYYVSQTILLWDLDPISISSLQQLYNSVLDSELPFLIVTIADDRDPQEDILGYAYAQHFGGLPAFGGTAEVFIYLDPHATGRGIGEKMLTLLLDMLRQGTDQRPSIREVLAVVPVDKAQDVSGFFLKQKFEERGLLKGVGWKMGKWIDVRYLQRSLHDAPVDTEQVVHTRIETVQEIRRPRDRWWSSWFRRRRKRKGQG